MNRKITLTIIISLVLQCACTRSDSDYKLPGVYRISVQQGNVIDQDMLDRLKPGMEKHQVRFIMGTPSIVDPFHPDRWEYIYTFTQGASQRKQRHLTIYFVDEKLAYLDGDVKTSLRKPPENLSPRSKIVEVPIREQKQKGLIGRVVDKLPFVGEDDAPPVVKTSETPGTAESDQEQIQPPEESTEESPANEPIKENDEDK